MKRIIAQIAIVTSLICTISSCAEKHEGLPQVRIKSEKIGWESKAYCTIDYLGPEEKIFDMPARIKYRGGHSARYEKHSYSLELDKKYAIAGLPKDDDWILNANYIDKTFMRHKVSYDLYQSMDEMNVSAASKYVELTVNDTAVGLYLITEEINGRQVGLDKKDTMAMLFKDPPFLFATKLTNPQDPDNYYQQKFPKIKKRDQTGYIENFRSFLFDADDERFAAKIGDWIDIRNVIDWHLLLLYSYNGDGVMKNFYLYKLDRHTPFRVAIWDYDHSFGRDGDNELNMMDRPFKWKRSILFSRLMNSKILPYQDLLRARYAQLRDDGLFSRAYMVEKMDLIDQRIAESVQSNAVLWPANSDWYYDDNDYEKEKEIVLRFVDLRLEVLDTEFDYSPK